MSRLNDASRYSEPVFLVVFPLVTGRFGGADTGGAGSDVRMIFSLTQ